METINCFEKCTVLLLSLFFSVNKIQRRFQVNLKSFIQLLFNVTLVCLLASRGIHSFTDASLNLYCREELLTPELAFYVTFIYMLPETYFKISS